MVTRRSSIHIAAGAIAAVIGFAMSWSGLAPLTEDRDADGYYLSDPWDVDRPTVAIITRDIGLLRGRYETLTEEAFFLDLMGEPDDVRMLGTATGEGAIFLGIAPSSDVTDYLDAVAHDEITDWDANLAAITDVEFTRHAGTAAPAPPASATFWVAAASGPGEQTLDWKIGPGDWAVAIMNADASPGVSAELRFGAAPPPNVERFAWIVFAIGLPLLVGGGFLIVFGVRTRRNEPVESTRASEAPGDPAA